MAGERQQEESIGLGGVLRETARIAGAAIAAPMEAALADGHIQAAGRQGIDELGLALKAFPDSIQTLSRDSFLSTEPYRPEQEQGRELEQEMDRGR